MDYSTTPILSHLRNTFHFNNPPMTERQVIVMFSESTLRRIIYHLVARVIPLRPLDRRFEPHREPHNECGPLSFFAFYIHITVN